MDRNVYTYPTGTFLVLSGLLLIPVHAGAGAWWGWLGHAGFAALAGAALRTALSRRDFARIRENHPDEARPTWILNWTLFGVGIPVVVWLLFALPVLVRTLRG